MKEGEIQLQVLKRLNVLIALQLDTISEKGSVSITNKVGKLLELGLAPSEIAGILGKPINYVTAVLSARRRARKE